MALLLDFQSSVFEGNLIVDSPNIPVASGRVEFDIEFLPCNLILATSRLAKQSAIQAGHSCLNRAPYDVLIPTFHPYK